MKSKALQLAEDFLRYVQQNPSQRFWQALRNWAGIGYIFSSQHAVIHLPTGGFMDEVKDTFYWGSKHE